MRVFLARTMWALIRRASNEKQVRALYGWQKKLMGDRKMELKVRA